MKGGPHGRRAREGRALTHDTPAKGGPSRAAPTPARLLPTAPTPTRRPPDAAPPTWLARATHPRGAHAEKARRREVGGP
ncbi:hypothetical protein GCM10010149_74350 [Nonomuraea roseoviolacea subsp. roseoviolacea]